MRLQNLGIATIGLAAGLLLRAQPPGPPPAPDFTELTAYLSLTDAQVTSLHDLNRAQRDAARTVSEDLRSKHQALNTALRSGSTDAATINSNALAVKAGEQKMLAIRQQHQAQAVATLTAAQQAKLKVLTDAAALAPSIRQASMLGLMDSPQQGHGGPGDVGGGMFRRGGPGGGPGGRGGRGGPPPPSSQQD